MTVGTQIERLQIARTFFLASGSFSLWFIHYCTRWNLRYDSFLDSKPPQWYYYSRSYQTSIKHSWEYKTDAKSIRYGNNPNGLFTRVGDHAGLTR